MSTAIDIGSFITASDDVRGGRPRIAHTGVTVQRVVRWHRLGLTPEEIADRIGHLNLAQVHAALSYYHASRAQVAADDREDERAASLNRNGAESKP